MRKTNSTNTSILPTIAVVVLVVCVIMGITNEFFMNLGTIQSEGVISEEFVDLLIATMLPWALCILAVFINGRDAKAAGRPIGVKMVRTAIICAVLACVGLAVGFLLTGYYNRAASVGFVLVFVTQVYGYIRSFFFWLGYYD